MAGETIDTRGVHLWLVLWKASRALAAVAEGHVESLGLCLSDFAVLEVLLHRGPLPVQEIGRKVLLTSGSITTAVDRLAAKGLVERQDDPDDRRVRRVRLTAAGSRLIRSAFREHARVLEDVAAPLSRAERIQLLGLLKTLGASAAGRAKDRSP